MIDLTDIPAFLDRRGKAKPAKPRVFAPDVEASREAKQIARECRELNEKWSKRRTRARKAKKRDGK